MEKMIDIAGKTVGFRSSGALPLLYKSYFGRDMFADLAALEDTTDAQSIDTEVFYNIVWTMARSHDKDIPTVIEWLDGFDEFPIFSIFADLQELLLASMQASKK
jgi:hypothetical protein